MPFYGAIVKPHIVVVTRGLIFKVYCFTSKQTRDLNADITISIGPCSVKIGCRNGVGAVSWNGNQFSPTCFSSLITRDRKVNANSKTGVILDLIHGLKTNLPLNGRKKEKKQDKKSGRS